MKNITLLVHCGLSLLLAASTASAQTTYEPYTFSTLAGKPPSRADGTGSAAGFIRPEGVAVDSAGNVYVADTLAQTVRKITPAGAVTTLAGLSGNRGSADGTGSAARFSHPNGAAVDGAGNVYVGERDNSTIRKISPSGTVSTLAGAAGNFGYADANGSAARFTNPNGVAIDSSGNVYVADYHNNIIRKITQAGDVSTFVGLAGAFGHVDGTGSSARFGHPNDVAIDGAGNLYVVDDFYNTVRKITPAGVVSTLAGSTSESGSADGTGTAARFNRPQGIAADGASNVYVADTSNQTIRKITAAGVVSTLAGANGVTGALDGTGNASRFNHPSGIAVDSSGNLYVADTINYTIRKITAAGSVSTFAGLADSSGSADGTNTGARFANPNGATVDGTGNIYLSDTFNNTIRKVTSSGSVTTLAGLAGTSGSTDGTGSAARFNRPYGIAVDGSGNLYVADTFNHAIRKITPSGAVTTLAGLSGSFGSADGTGTAARFNHPHGIAVDGAGAVYVGDSFNNTIRKITPSGSVSTLAGLAGGFGFADGVGSAARFNSPRGLAVDGIGNVYVGDYHNAAIRKVTPSGAVSTFAGQGNSSGFADGTGSAARFGRVPSLAIDGSGNLYATDETNETIRKITPAAVVTTLGGFVGSAGSVDAAGSAARFHDPAGVAVNSAGTIYVADTINNTIRVGVSAAPPPGFANISTRVFVGVNDGVLVNAFTIQGGGPKKVLMRAIGPSLNVSGALADPTLQLRDASGAVIFFNNDWRTGGQEQEIINTTIQPTNDREAAIVATLNPGTYTATQRGINGTTGVGINEVYDLESQSSNISAIGSRAQVFSGDNVLISGLILTGSQPRQVLVRALGPSLTTGVTNALADPTLELFDANGSLINTNGNWEETQRQPIIDSGLAPIDSRESALITTLAPGPYTAVVRGTNSTNGIAFVQWYTLPHIAPALNPTPIISNAPTITSAATASATEGQPFSYQITATGNPTSFNATGLPAGLSVNPNTGLISGTTTAIGTFSVQLTASNGDGSGTATLTLTVQRPLPAITSPLSVSGIAGQQFTYQLVATNANSVIASGNLPPGLAFDASLRALVGTPTTAGTYQVTFSATNQTGTTTVTVTITIQPEPPAGPIITSGTSATARVGQRFTFQVITAGATSAARLSATGLPAGLTADAVTGVISGTPTTAGSFAVTLTVADGQFSTTSTLQLTITADPAFPVITSASETSVTPGQPFTYTIAAPVSDPNDPVTYALFGNLPPGLSFDPATGKISGTPIVQSRHEGRGKPLSGGVITNVQIFATNSRGTATTQLVFFLAPTGIVNIATRVAVGTEQNVLIGGFIITGNAPKKVIIRAIAPSIRSGGQFVPGTLQDPTLQLLASGSVLGSNDDWRSNQEQEIIDTTVAPSDDRESAIVATLNPGPYTAIISGKEGATGIGVVEVYDLGTASLDTASNAKLANISTRGFVQRGDDIMIGGFIVTGGSARAIVRAVGPSLADNGVQGALEDTTLDLRDGNGSLIVANDDWRTGGQEQQIIDTTVPPSNDRESAVVATLNPGAYTAVVRGKNDSQGVGLVEVYALQ